MIYGAVLLLHSIVRWVALVAGMLALVRAANARKNSAAYERGHRALGSAFVGSLQLNFVLGLLLFAVLSPLTDLAFENVSAAMASSMLRFFLVEHPFGMLVAIAIASIGAGKIRRAKDDAAKHKRTLAYYGSALAIIFVSIPWPFYPAGRPLLHWPF
jgi:NADH:ubiquinone oxidoreductase subunit 3 (subunit A)